MAHPKGEAKLGPLRIDFDRRLKLEFHGSQISSDGGLLPCRELDLMLGLSALASDALSEGRPGTEVRFMIGLLLLKHIYGLSDEAVCERWVHDPHFQYFTGEAFFQHALPHERSGLSHWRKRIGDKLEVLLAESLRVAHETGALKTDDVARVTVDTTVQPKNVPGNPGACPRAGQRPDRGTATRSAA